MYVIEPYISVDSLRFGYSTVSDCLADYGKPNSTSKSYYGKVEYGYDDLTIRFDQDHGDFCEATLLPYAQARINGIAVTWDINFLRAVCDMDGDPLLVYGFIVLNKIGLAITGIHDDDNSQLAVTAYAKGSFDDMLQDGKPYHMA